MSSRRVTAEHKRCLNPCCVWQEQDYVLLGMPVALAATGRRDSASRRPVLTRARVIGSTLTVPALWRLHDS